MPVFGAPKRHRRLAVATLVSLLLTGCAPSVGERASTPSAASTGPPAVARCEEPAPAGVSTKNIGLPTLVLPCLGGGPDVPLRGLTGRPTLVNLWASWCAPCRDEMPMLQQAFEQHGERFRFLGVATRDTPAIAADFVSGIGVAYPHAVDADGELLTALGVPGLPVTLALDAEGRVLATQIGQMTPEELASIIRELEASMTPSPP